VRARYRRWATRLRARFHGGSLTVWTHPDYRLPLTSISARTGLDPRRADLAAWALLDLGVIEAADLRTPAPATWAEIGRVHGEPYLDSLALPGELARIYAVEPWDLPVGEVMRTLRLACGGTLEAARHVRDHGGAAMNLGGGMHHAAPNRGAGFCPLNDIAVALAALRAEGFEGTVGVLDLDAHPPDGTAECLHGDPSAWIGSLSGSDWGPHPGRVDETVLPAGTGDAEYLHALEALLGRAPDCDLLFVLAGGDVRAEDPVGELGLSEAGVSARDVRVARWCGQRPTVWLPAGGYGPRSWRTPVGAGLAVVTGAAGTIPEKLSPLRGQLGDIAGAIRPEELEGDEWFTEADLVGLMGGPVRERRLLDFYTTAGLELALERYGLLELLRRFGYGWFRAVVDRASAGDRLRVFARRAEDPPGPSTPPADRGLDDEFLLVELVVEKDRTHPDLPLLFVHWMTLRHPLAEFADARPPLPGQEVPGLGLAKEAGELLGIVARRLGLAGVAVRPSWFHVAYASRYEFRFDEPVVQGRFEALSRDLVDLPLLDRTRAIADGQVTMDGEPYAWDAALMHTLPPEAGWREAADVERDRVRFSFVGSPPAAG
jgi:acetoin utilization deacetylase AcuC-like enzyme